MMVVTIVSPPIHTTTAATWMARAIATPSITAAPVR
jgi:hypothetical protein